MIATAHQEVAKNENWLPFVDAFRTFCLHPGPDGTVLLQGISHLVTGLNQQAILGVAL